MHLKVFPLESANAAENMARDLALVHQCAEEQDFAFLRWYTWSPPAFSLGYGQKPEHVLDLEKTTALNVPWCKRPTGGALVYHHGDLSYGFVIARRNPFDVVSGDDLYSFLNDAFLEGFRELGVSLYRPDEVPKFRDVPQDVRQLCLAHFSQGDLLATVASEKTSAKIAYSRKKIGGSAQRRFRNTWLQQGFFALQPPRIPDVFCDAQTRTLMQLSCVDLKSLGFSLTHEKVQDALTQALSKRFAEVFR